MLKNKSQLIVGALLASRVLSESYGHPWDSATVSQDFLPNPSPIGAELSIWDKVATAPELSALHEVATGAEAKRKAKLSALRKEVAELEAEMEAPRRGTEDATILRTVAETKAKMEALETTDIRKIAEEANAQMEAFKAKMEAATAAMSKRDEGGKASVQALLAALVDVVVMAKPKTKEKVAAWEAKAAKLDAVLATACNEGAMERSDVGPNAAVSEVLLEIMVMAEPMSKAEEETWKAAVIKLGAQAELVKQARVAEIKAAEEQARGSLFARIRSLFL
jgi:hypothetical protein